MSNTYYYYYICIGSANNFNEDDIQSFELAPGAQNTRQGNVTSDSIDDTLFNGLSGAGGFGIDNGNNNESILSLIESFTSLDLLNCLKNFVIT